MKTFIFACLAMGASALISTAAFATDVHKTVSVSPDGSTTTTTTRYYYDKDVNDNGIIDSDEFPSYVYSKWDRNRDGFISSDEWDTGRVYWYGPKTTTVKTYTAWDKNGDGRLDVTEFDSVLADTKLYDTWDVNADKSLDISEYHAATFRQHDLDGNGTISIDEWKNSQN